jgi:hypothetical protein
MMDFENDANPFEDRRISISVWRRLAAVDISASEGVLSRARRIHLMGFKPKDSIHLSCAIEAGSSIFFTTDTGILKKADLISDLALINPVDYEFNKP